MIKKVIKIKNLNDKDSIIGDLKYWLSKPPEKRVEAIDYLRKQFYGSSERLQRVSRVTQRP